MEKLKFNPNNKKYYSDEFIKGFECGVERQFNVDMAENTMEQTVEELEKIQAEMDNKGWYNKHDREQFAEIVDKHIAELKGENDK